MSEEVYLFGVKRLRIKVDKETAAAERDKRRRRRRRATAHHTVHLHRERTRRAA